MKEYGYGNGSVPHASCPMPHAPGCSYSDAWYLTPMGLLYPHHSVSYGKCYQLECFLFLYYDTHVMALNNASDSAL
ncbi:hypothetical protein VNO78_32073 [Psophocarpus tetragonolobus]|uniref:Uncharacterized protein n=1 Tax=Psophocarpus tetragonolobus TaxID=3891 RepID=A0AAN9X7Y0_PSOTE